MLISPDECPNRVEHHPDPDPTIMRPRPCPDCRRFLIWVPYGESSQPLDESLPLPTPIMEIEDPYALPERYLDPGPPVVAVHPELMDATMIEQAIKGEVIYVPLEDDQMT